MSTVAQPRPKGLALTVLVDWSNQDKADATGAAGVKSTCHPCWLCVHFGPPPSTLPNSQQAPMAGQWQLTLNIYSAEKTPLVKKQEEQPIPKERRALLWHGTQPFDQYRYAVVMPHCRFPVPLTPRVIAFHADRAEPDANALVFVRKKTSQKRHKEDSYLKVVRGHIYHLHMTFPDGSLVNQYIAQGWGFTASLFTFKRKRGHITVSPSRAVTQIRANWLDVVEPDPDQEELYAAQRAKALDEQDDQDEPTTPSAKKKREEELRKKAEAAVAAARAAANSSNYSSSSSSSSSNNSSSSSSSNVGFGSAYGVPQAQYGAQQYSYGAPNAAQAQYGAGAGAAAAAAVGGSYPPIYSYYNPSGQIGYYSPVPPYAGAPIAGYDPQRQPLYQVVLPTQNQAPMDAQNQAPDGAAQALVGLAAQGFAPADGGVSAFRRRATDWTQTDLDNVISTMGDVGNVMPDYAELLSTGLGNGINLNSYVKDFFDTPSASTATSSTTSTTVSTMPPPMSPSDRELLTLFRSLEQRAKMVASDQSSKLREAAVRLTQVLSASGQLDGWRHVEEFMTNPEAYIKKQRATINAATAPGGAAAAAGPAMDTKGSEPKGKVETLMDDSQTLLRNAMMRAKWVLEIEKKNTGKLSDGKTLERVLAVLLKDKKWMDDSALFLKQAEIIVSGLINMNPANFAKFRELQSRGVQWPHSPDLRRHVKRAGFVFRPMMIKRDRCVCDACGVEVSGWRPWHNPWLFHDWSKRHPFAPPPGTLSRAGTALEST